MAVNKYAACIYQYCGSIGVLRCPASTGIQPKNFHTGLKSADISVPV